MRPGSHILPCLSAVEPAPHVITSPSTRSAAMNAVPTATCLNLCPARGSNGGGRCGRQTDAPLGPGAHTCPSPTSQHTSDPVAEIAHTSWPTVTDTKTPAGGGKILPGPQHASSPAGRTPQPHRSTSSDRNGPAGGWMTPLPQHRAAPPPSITHDSWSPAATRCNGPGHFFRPLEGRPHAASEIATANHAAALCARDERRRSATLKSVRLLLKKPTAIEGTPPSMRTLDGPWYARAVPSARTGSPRSLTRTLLPGAATLVALTLFSLACAPQKEPASSTRAPSAPPPARSHDERPATANAPAASSIPPAPAPPSSAHPPLSEAELAPRMAQNFESSPLEPTRATERQFQQAFATLTTGARLDAISCRKSICRARIFFPTTDVENRTITALFMGAQATFPIRSAAFPERIKNPDGSYIAVIYFSRDIQIAEALTR